MNSYDKLKEAMDLFSSEGVPYPNICEIDGKTIRTSKNRNGSLKHEELVWDGKGDSEDNYKWIPKD